MSVSFLPQIIRTARGIRSIFFGHTGPVVLTAKMHANSRLNAAAPPAVLHGRVRANARLRSPNQVVLRARMRASARQRELTTGTAPLKILSRAAARVRPFPTQTSLLRATGRSLSKALPGLRHGQVLAARARAAARVRGALTVPGRLQARLRAAHRTRAGAIGSAWIRSLLRATARSIATTRGQFPGLASRMRSVMRSRDRPPSTASLLRSNMRARSRFGVSRLVGNPLAGRLRGAAKSIDDFVVAKFSGLRSRMVNTARGQENVAAGVAIRGRVSSAARIIDPAQPAGNALYSTVRASLRIIGEVVATPFSGLRVRLSSASRVRGRASVAPPVRGRVRGSLTVGPVASTGAPLRGRVRTLGSLPATLIAFRAALTSRMSSSSRARSPHQVAPTVLAGRMRTAQITRPIAGPFGVALRSALRAAARSTSTSTIPQTFNALTGRVSAAARGVAAIATNAALSVFSRVGASAHFVTLTTLVGVQIVDDAMVASEFAEGAITPVAPMPPPLIQSPHLPGVEEIGRRTTYALPDGAFPTQRILIVDNLNLASPSTPIVITGKFNSGTIFVFNVPGQAIEPVWNGSVWDLA